MFKHLYELVVTYFKDFYLIMFLDDAQLGLKFSSLPLSPLTDVIHRDTEERRHKDHWQDILGEESNN